MAATIQTIQKPTRARALDTSGNNNHGQLYSGRALEFDGVSDYLSVNGGSVLTLVDYSAGTTNAERAWTVATWFRFDSAGTTHQHILGNETNNAIGYMSVTSAEMLGVWDMSSSWIQGSTALDINTWYRGAIVFDGDSTITIYVNGVQTATGTISTSGAHADLAFKWIGDWDPTHATRRQFPGALSDLQCWQGAWTADDLLYDYNNPESLALNRGGTLLTNSNLKAWYPMNDGHRGQQSYILDAAPTLTHAFKNHATTAFYGDMTDIMEDDASSPGSNDYGNLYNTANTKFDFTSESVASGTDTYDVITNSAATSVNSASAKIETDNSSTGLEIYNSAGTIPFCNFEGVTVVGRTYQVDLTCYSNTESFIDALTNLAIGTSAGGTQYETGQTSGGGTTISRTFTATQTAVFIGVGPFSLTSGHKVRIKTLQIREVGTASGWTDADQQLDIPQTALQSYNELAWFQGAASGQYGTLDSQIATTTNNWSLSFWIFHFENDLNYDIPIGSATGGKYLALDNNGTRKLFFRDDAGTYHALSSGAIPQGRWVHIVVTALGDTSMTAYVDNVAQTTNSDMSDTELVIDRIMAGYSTSNLQTRGSITEISYYGSYILTASHVSDLYNGYGQFPNPKSALDASSSAGLTHYWRNNGLSEWQDLKGSNDINLTNVTETMLITPGVDSSRDSQGFLMNRQRLTNSLNYYSDVGGGSIENIGAQTKVSGSPLTEAQLEAMTVTFWFKSPDNTQTDSLVNVVTDSAAEFIVQTQGNGRFRWTYEIDGFGGDTRYKTVAGVFSTDKWTFVAFALDHDAGTDANRVLCYVGDEDNAVSLQTNDGTQTGTPTSGMEDDSMWIGGEKTSGRKFVGEIDDVCVYSKTLTLAEIKRNYNAGKRSHI